MSFEFRQEVRQDIIEIKSMLIEITELLRDDAIKEEDNKYEPKIKETD